MGPMHSRVSTGDADYAALVKQWCFARSPSSMSGTPVSETGPAAPGSASAGTELLQPKPSMALPQVRLPTAQDFGSAGLSSESTTPALEKEGWLAMGEDYMGLGSLSMQVGKA
jgi:hypothetical protein